MPPRGHVTIPPERQSARRRANVNYNEASIDYETNAETNTNTKRLPGGYQPPPIVSQAAEVDEDWEAAEEAEAEEGDDDDGTRFQSGPCLPPSVVQRWKLVDLMECIDNDLIELNPEYQRDIVWKPNVMSGLINSLIEDFYINPIIFNLDATPGPNGDQILRRICIDGKQRLSSVYAFMRGEIACRDKFGKPWYYCQPKNGPKQRLRLWPESMCMEFRAKSFVCYEYKNLNRTEEEDLFARVQKGAPLSASEKLAAVSGEWQGLAKDFEKDFENVVQLSATARGQGFRNLLGSFCQILEVKHPSRADGQPATKIQMPSITSLCKKTKCTHGDRSFLASVFTRFSEIVEMSPQTFANNNYKIARNFAPIEFVAVAVLISVYMNKRNNNMLIGDIAAMRQETRKALADFRMDNITWKTLWQYIEELETFRGASSGTTLMDRATANHHRASVRARTVQATNTRDEPESSAPPVPSARWARMRSSSVDSIDGTSIEDSVVKASRPPGQPQQSPGLPLRPLVPDVAGPTQQSTPVMKTELHAQGHGSNKRRDNAALKAAALQAKRARLSQGYSRPT